MEQEQLKEEILQQLRLERQVREEFERRGGEGPTEKPRFAWLESKIGLLVVGAVVSGVFVPAFQFTQETFKWMRENRYNALTRQIDDMRNSLKQLIAAHALLAATYNLGLSIPDELMLKDAARAQEARARIRDLRLQRIQQNGTFASTILFFPRSAQGGIRSAWNDYLAAADRLQYAVDDGVRISMGPGGRARDQALNDALRQLDTQVPECNRRYESVLCMLQASIEEVERESARFQ